MSRSTKPAFPPDRSEDHLLSSLRGTDDGLVSRRGMRKKKGMVTHPRVLTQRTPVLRSGVLLSLLRALLSAAFFRGGFLLGAALLCSCHSVLLLSLDFTSYTRYCSVSSLVY